MPGNDNLYIGLISGTSMDCLDIALVAVSAASFEVRETTAVVLDTDLRSALLALCESGDDELHRLAQADTRFAQFCANAVLDAMAGWAVDKGEVKAIGSHGQTVRHAPAA